MNMSLSPMDMDRLVSVGLNAPPTLGMIALVPTANDAQKLHIPGFERAEELHLTLLFLGQKDRDDEEKTLFRAAGVAAARAIGGPVVGDVWARAGFNPYGQDPCVTYLVGGQGVKDARDEVKDAVEDLEYASQHVPWIPHITIAYSSTLSPTALNQMGPVVFDRLRVAFGSGDEFDIKL